MLLAKAGVLNCSEEKACKYVCSDKLAEYVILAVKSKECRALSQLPNYDYLLDNVQALRPFPPNLVTVDPGSPPQPSDVQEEQQPKPDGRREWKDPAAHVSEEQMEYEEEEEQPLQISEEYEEARSSSSRTRVSGASFEQPEDEDMEFLGERPFEPRGVGSVPAQSQKSKL